MRFTDHQPGRYDRQELIHGWDQAVLRQARVVVAGAGALGNELLKLLALMGVGTVIVVDFDTVSYSNLSRTVLFTAADVGQSKAEVAARRAMAINPEVTIIPIHGDIGRDLGLGPLRDADFVLAGLDSVNARRLVNHRCQLAGVPWNNGGISDSQGQVTRYDPAVPEAACYECTLTTRSRLRAAARYSCTGLKRQLADDPMPTTAITASLTAALQVDDMVRFLHDRAAGLPPGHRLSYLLDAQRATRDLLPRDPACPLHHPPRVPTHTLAPAEDPATLTPATLVAAVGPPTPAATVHLELDLVLRFSCPTCGDTDVMRPVELVYDTEAICPTCAAERTAVITPVATPDLPIWTTPLAALGIAPRELLLVATDAEHLAVVALGGPDPWAA